MSLTIFTEDTRETLEVASKAQVGGSEFIQTTDGRVWLQTLSDGIRLYTGTLPAALDGEETIDTTTSFEVTDSYAGEDSHQTFAADLVLDADAGAGDGDSAFLAPFMGNVIGDDLTKTRNYIGGQIGALSVTGAKASDFQVGALIGVVMDGVTEGDAAVVGVIDGSDPSSETTVTAVFAGRQNNAHPDSGALYGLDLHDPGRGDVFSVPGEGLPLNIKNATVRSASGVCYLDGVGAPVDYTDGTPPATGEGWAEIGSHYTNRTNGDVYINTGTKAHPVWSQLAFVS